MEGAYRGGLHWFPPRIFDERGYVFTQKRAHGRGDSVGIGLMFDLALESRKGNGNGIHRVREENV